LSIRKLRKRSAVTRKYETCLSEIKKEEEEEEGCTGLEV
jgi:hypothetical protein